MASGQNYIGAASIPGTYQRLKIEFEGFSTETSGTPLQVSLAFNTDNSGNYASSYTQTGNGGCSTTGAPNGANFGVFGFLPYTGDSVNGLQPFDESTAEINNYASTAGPKQFRATYDYWLDSEGICTGSTSTIWYKSAAQAITGFYIQMAGGHNIAAGSNVKVYAEN